MTATGELVSALDVLRAIDQLRRDLGGYHGQLKAHDDLQRHCDNQRRRIGELERLYAGAKAERDEAVMAFGRENARANVLMAENAKLRELVRDIWQFTGAACKKYPRLFDQPAQGAQAVLPNAIDYFEQRMRGLGVEVDG